MLFPKQIFLSLCALSRGQSMPINHTTKYEAGGDVPVGAHITQ